MPAGRSTGTSQTVRLLEATAAGRRPAGIRRRSRRTCSASITARSRFTCSSGASGMSASSWLDFYSSLPLARDSARSPTRALPLAAPSCCRRRAGGCSAGKVHCSPGGFTNVSGASMNIRRHAGLVTMMASRWLPRRRQVLRKIVDQAQPSAGPVPASMGLLRTRRLAGERPEWRYGASRTGSSKDSRPRMAAKAPQATRGSRRRPLGRTSPERTS